jgi:hypothetical protein
MNGSPGPESPEKPGEPGAEWSWDWVLRGNRGSDEITPGLAATRKPGSWLANIAIALSDLFDQFSMSADV